MIVFKPGSKFLLNQQLVTVDYVIVNKNDLFIQLVEVEQRCRPQDLKPVVAPPRKQPVKPT
ncbi:hypothetical protein CDN99_04575 [Roseateles aquatilis]|uniref:Uncharacterized protein n=1 Tax=Roseateles aquatilis TaxID=431061 RepID=A0A246JMF5_9BURK|nr:hypothetical protein [Roseateles aquatilis]OWQ93730.1 hypothetical protein CDN99_04575 [Roseateles aquatilis]